MKKSLRQKKTFLVEKFDDILKILGGFQFNNEVMMTRMTEANIKRANDNLQQFKDIVKLDLMTTILILEGEITFSVNYQKIKLSRHSLMFISPYDSLTGPTVMSQDGTYYILMVKRSFIDKYLNEPSPTPSPAIFDSHINPYFHIEEDEDFLRLKNSFDTLYKYMGETITLKEYFLKHSLNLLLLEVLNALTEQLNIPIETGNIPRSEEIIRKFMRLLQKYGEREHSPSFYAEKLFISVQYLSSVLKEHTRENCSAWIGRHITQKAKRLLMAPGATIQKVAEELNFADQSSFGKFFKKHTGTTPKKFMNSI
ncbi:MAG: AraC family transcriptional regulator [Bacteroidales bacterium]|nr:AraC family transcriptional regulator [Bacteroidales bacterium]